MHSLFDALLAQHGRQLTPVRCAYSTITQLQRYFEDVVLENNLGALIIESLPPIVKRPSREIARIRELARGGRRTFFFLSPSDSLHDTLSTSSLNPSFEPVVLPHSSNEHGDEHFIVIADSRFSALLATVHSGDENSGEDEVIWTFEPDVVYSALEYLMARVRAEQPYHSSVFGNAVRTSMPKATSLQLTLSVTTKLAHLLQEQAGREIAINRIATTIRESLELGVVLQKTVTEVGSALNVACCALRVEGQNEVQPLSYSHFAERKAMKLPPEDLIRELEIASAGVENTSELLARDGSDDFDADSLELPVVLVPLVFHGKFIGVLQVLDDNLKRTWQENEILLLRTVADQVAVAINHADLYAQMQQQALTDVLTGCYNRRSFEMQLDRELQMAVRLQEPLSLLMLDVDNFKDVNDTAGHDAGDSALRKLSACFQQELRAVDTAARFGGDEFALILPRADCDGALLVAERLRARIQEIRISTYGNLTVSIGIASFPAHGTSRTGLIVAADAALYSAKRRGRNRVVVFDAKDNNAPEILLAVNRHPPDAVDQAY